jgi:threonine synthase
MMDWTDRVGAMTGIFCAPEGAATVAALPRLIDRGLIGPHDEIVLFNTGSGLKYVRP